VKILHNSFEKGKLLVEDYLTGFESSVPRNPHFYTEFYHPFPVKDSTNEAILVILQEEDSALMRVDSRFFKTQEDVLRALMVVSQKCKNNFVVFGAKNEYENTHNVFFTEKSYEEFLPVSQAVITCNDVRAISVLKYGKPIFLLGDAFFNIEGIAFSVNSVEGLLQLVQNLENLPFDEQTAVGFLRYLSQRSVHCLNLERPSESSLDEITNIFSL
jgi:hypothetical protein